MKPKTTRTLLKVEKPLYGVDYIKGLWNGELFEGVAVWSRDVSTSDPENRSI